MPGGQSSSVFGASFDVLDRSTGISMSIPLGFVELLLADAPLDLPGGGGGFLASGDAKVGDGRGR
jgi:hypothetical protein